MLRKKTPPEYGLSGGPMMVACQWNRSSETGPAEQLAGGSFPRSSSSLLIRLLAISQPGDGACRPAARLRRRVGRRRHAGRGSEDGGGGARERWRDGRGCGPPGGARGLVAPARGRGMRGGAREVRAGGVDGRAGGQSRRSRHENEPRAPSASAWARAAPRWPPYYPGESPNTWRPAERAPSSFPERCRILAPESPDVGRFAGGELIGEVLVRARGC